MPGNLTPPILSEAVEAGRGSVGAVHPPDPLPPPVSPTAGAADEVASTQDRSLLEELNALREWQRQESSSRLELIESHERRERELNARLDQAQQIIDAGIWELDQLQKLQLEQRTALRLQQEQHQSELTQSQQSLAAARQELERGQADLQGLRQRCALLEQECDRRERRLNELEPQLRAAAEQLGNRDAELATARQRCESLERQLQEAERAGTSRVEELAALQERCEASQRQLQESERASTSRVEELQQQLHAAAERLASHEAELAAAQERSEALQRQLQESRERPSGSRLQALDAQGVGASAAAEPSHAPSIRDLETQRLRDELIALQQLLEELPDIYEHKFRQRLQPVLQQRDWLLHENSWLRAELPAAAAGQERPALPQAARLGGLLERVQALLPLRRPGRRLQAIVTPEIDPNSGDDGPPTAA